ncbi:VG15 protein [Arthrobacter sp. FW306-2-2C-D06B]|uniref:VG15 protein n=1 Tax=Arthrobacter sp. FW306-2-2C-D06B TaxID=2879618 RepID=UPI001F35A014|nr:hypothetical protein [Arthrobacter sp. FW306-2-2C-D06B]UKA59168.1 hypothetical protein LFT47_02090 [Arthrobacter sp. FW306-2-2C-D06B]
MADPITEQFRAANAGLSKLVRDELEGFFGTLNLAKPEAVRNALLEFVPLLVSEYGSVAETLALDYYDELRAASGATGVFRAIAGADGIPGSAVEAKIRYLAKQLWTPDPASMLGGLLTATDKYVKQPGRDAISYNAKREGARWARVPTGAKTCSWCLVLASRDAVYLSKQSAGDRRGTGKGDAFHGDCNCAVVRIGKASDYPPGYLPDDYLAMYEAARADAASGDIKDISAAFRRLHPDAVTDAVHTH